MFFFLFLFSEFTGYAEDDISGDACKSITDVDGSFRAWDLVGVWDESFASEAFPFEELVFDRNKKFQAVFVQKPSIRFFNVRKQLLGQQ